MTTVVRVTVTFDKSWSPLHVNTTCWTTNYNFMERAEIVDFGLIDERKTRVILRVY